MEIAYRIQPTGQCNVNLRAYVASRKRARNSSVRAEGHSLAHDYVAVLLRTLYAKKRRDTFFRQKAAIFSSDRTRRDVASHVFISFRNFAYTHSELLLRYERDLTEELRLCWNLRSHFCPTFLPFYCKMRRA